MGRQGQIVPEKTLQRVPEKTLHKVGMRLLLECPSQSSLHFFHQGAQQDIVYPPHTQRCVLFLSSGAAHYACHEDMLFISTMPTLCCMWFRARSPSPPATTSRSRSAPSPSTRTTTSHASVITPRCVLRARPVAGRSNCTVGYLHAVAALALCKLSQLHLRPQVERAHSPRCAATHNSVPQPNAHLVLLPIPTGGPACVPAHADPVAREGAGQDSPSGG